MQNKLKEKTAGARLAETALRSRFLEESFDLYRRGFDEDLNHFYPGLNALAMLMARVELATQLGPVWTESFDDAETAALKLTSLKSSSLSSPPASCSRSGAGKSGCSARYEDKIAYLIR